MTLKMRSNLRARNTLIPKDVPGLMTAQMTSKMLPMITWNHSWVSRSGPGSRSAHTSPDPGTQSSCSPSRTLAWAPLGSQGGAAPAQ